MLCEVRLEWRNPPDEDTPDETAGLASDLAGGDEESAIVAISEEEMATPHDEQNRLFSGNSLEHDGQRMV